MEQKLLLTCFAGACTLVSAFSASAEADDVETLLGRPETISIATGRAQNISTAPAVATLITAEQIRNYGIRNVAEALRLVPGMHAGVMTTNAATFSVRGFSSPASINILFLLDGVPQADTLLESEIPIDVIDRIEVTRGPGSVVFGADAFSAVVNVITTKSARENRLAASVGSWNTAQGRARLAFSDSKGLEGVLGVSAQSTAGADPYFPIDNQSLIDAQMGTSASFAPANGDTARRDLGLLLNLRYGQTEGMLRYARFYDMGMSAGLAGNLDPIGKQAFEIYEAKLVQNIAVTDDLSVALTANARNSTWTLDNVMLLGPGAFGVYPYGAFITQDSINETFRLQADGRYDGFQTHRPAFGIGYQNLTNSYANESANFISSGLTLLPTPTQVTANTPEQNRGLTYAYVEDEWTLMPRWTLTYGARVDNYTDFGTQISPRAVLVWAADPLWTFKLLYGQGYRSPTFMETKTSTLPVYESNPDLEPERLRTLDFSIGYAPTSRLDFQLNLYAHETVDQIRQQNMGTYFYPENIGDQRGRGGEFAMNWTILPNLSFYGWYGYQWNDDETTGENVGYTPQHRLFGSLQYTLGKAFFNLQGTYVGDRARVANDTREEPDEYGRLDLLGRYQFTPQLSLQLDIRNLLNQQSYEATQGTTFAMDYPLPERNYYLTMRVDF